MSIRKKSHLLQMRGLKPKNEHGYETLRSRIFYRCVDWNNPLLCFGKRNESRIFYRCVDWNISWNTLYRYTIVASFTDAWIETGIGAKKRQEAASRIFYRCVDWNPVSHFKDILKVRRIFYRCVDWNYPWELGIGIRNKSHLLQMRGLKLKRLGGFQLAAKSHLLQMRGLKQWRRTKGSCGTRRIFYRCVDWNKTCKQEHAL